MKQETIQSPRGVPDILPDQQKYWRFIRDIVEKKCQSFGFKKIDLPFFEDQRLFARGIGNSTDIVEKEMFELKKTSEEEEAQYVLRPEATASVVRAYIQHGMRSWPQPVKMYYWGPMFRRERPQKGRFRQFYQFGFEVLGNIDPHLDANVILLAWQILEAIGISKDLVTEINSVGCSQCRPEIRKKILEFYSQYQDLICPDCQRRYLINPLRLLDCKDKKCLPVIASAPQIIDNLCRECKNHFTVVLETLDELEIPYDLNPRLIRGLDYYTKTAFEFRELKDKDRQSSLGGGGRYDDLIELFGGKKTPAIGLAMGIERIIEKIKEKKIRIPELIGPKVFVVQLGEDAKKCCLKIVSQLDREGIGAACNLSQNSLREQLGLANKAKSPFALILGQREIYDKTVILRDMKNGVQDTIDQKEIVEKIKEQIGTIKKKK